MRNHSWLPRLHCWETGDQRWEGTCSGSHGDPVGDPFLPESRWGQNTGCSLARPPPSLRSDQHHPAHLQSSLSVGRTNPRFPHVRISSLDKNQL